MTATNKLPTCRVDIVRTRERLDLDWFDSLYRHYRDKRRSETLRMPGANEGHGLSLSRSIGQ